MIVAIASENKPKVSACKKVFNELHNEFNSHDEISYITKNIESEVADMPLCIEDLMQGAKNRAEKLYRLLHSENRQADYFIGPEGGFFLKYDSKRSKPVVFLESWIYVFNGKIGYWGSSGAIEIPELISDDILHTGKELSEVIDIKMNGHDIRSNQGTVGILTKNKISRQKFFESALLFALAPFYNSILYS